MMYENEYLLLPSLFWLSNLYESKIVKWKWHTKMSNCCFRHCFGSKILYETKHAKWKWHTKMNTCCRRCCFCTGIRTQPKTQRGNGVQKCLLVASGMAFAMHTFAAMACQLKCSPSRKRTTSRCCWNGQDFG